jgi:hypothetical protein
MLFFVNNTNGNTNVLHNIDKHCLKKAVFIGAQFAVLAIDLLCGTNYALLVWMSTGIVGLMFIWVSIFNRAPEIGLGRFFISLLFVLIMAIVVWFFVMIFIFNVFYDNGNVVVLILMLPTLSLWSTGWFSLLHIGPFAGRSRPVEEEPF